jgi:LuxR family transcriptional regulator, maltose regulon positive regulatory protein
MSGEWVDSRLVIPVLPPGHISRPRLLAVLDDAVGVPLTLLAAGPGAGKTVLLSEWALRGDAPVAWITMTAADAAPRRFSRLLRAALRACWERGHGPPDETPRDEETGPARSLLADMSDHPVRPVLIIDDAHLLAHRRVLSDLDALIRSGSPPPLRLVLAARSDPLLPLHRYRLAGQMRELRAADLTMTRGELRDLLAAHGVKLRSADLDALLTRTEGWAAGARLSAMRMENASNPAQLVGELALDQGSIGEYLLAEVLDPQPEPVRRLLRQTSLFDEVTVPLAEAVTRMDGCAGMLTALARSNSFVVPLDSARTRFRYHRLLGEILRHDLRQEERSVVPGLMRRAAAYFQDAGDVGEALRWAAQVGDWPHAASLLARGGLAHAFVHREDLPDFRPGSPQLVRGDIGTAQAGDAAIASSSIAAVAAGAESAARDLDALDPMVEGGVAIPQLIITTELARLILGMKAGEAKAVAAAAECLLAQARHGSEYRVPGLPAAVLLAQASIELWHGQNDEAETCLHAARAEAEHGGPATVELEVLAMTALADSLRCRPRHAGDAVLRARALLGNHRELLVPPALKLAAACRLLMAADLAGAARALQEVHVADTVGSDPGLVVACRIGQAAVLLARGDVNAARAILHTASSRTNLPMLKVLRNTLLADVETRLGRPQAALGLLRDYRNSNLAVLAASPCARAFLALHDTREAQHCVRTVLTTTCPLVSRYVLAEAMLHDAQIAQLGSDPQRALDVITGAIELAQDDIVLPFSAMRGVFAPLLAHHPAVAAQWPHPPGHSQTDVTAPSGRQVPDLHDPLTERELAVLRLLAIRLPTADIAAEMCLSVNTVKTYLAGIYRKLPASGRKDAVMRARQLELL